MKTIFAVFFMLLCASSVFAETVRVRPDGHTSMRVSVDGPTRISIKNDRIASIIQSDSQFEMVNDANTGDVFLRFVGTHPGEESGHIVTEGGHTIGFTLRPDKSLGNQTVLVDLIGVQESETQTDEGEATGTDKFVVSEGGSQSPGSALTRCVRAAFESKIGSRRAGSHRDGLGRFRRGSCSARILTSNADARPQSFYNNRVKAVWVDDVVVGGRRWVIVVE